MRSSNEEKKKDRSVEGTRALYEQQRKRLDSDIRRIENESKKCKSRNYKAGLDKTLETLRREFQNCQRDFDEFRCNLIASRLDVFKKRATYELWPVFWNNLNNFIEEKDRMLSDVG